MKVALPMLPFLIIAFYFSLRFAGRKALIQKSLATLTEGRTTFVIAHRLSTIRKAHKILVIEGGRIVEQGTHDQLIKANGRYFDLFTYQAKI